MKLPIVGRKLEGWLAGPGEFAWHDIREDMVRRRTVGSRRCGGSFFSQLSFARGSRGTRRGERRSGGFSDQVVEERRGGIRLRKLREIRDPIKELGINGGRISLSNRSVEYSVRFASSLSFSSFYLSLLSLESCPKVSSFPLLLSFSRPGALSRRF